MGQSHTIYHACSARFYCESMTMKSKLTCKGQVTIPQHVRASRQGPGSGFGLIKSRRKGVPADLDGASVQYGTPVVTGSEV